MHVLLFNLIAFLSSFTTFVLIGVLICNTCYSELNIYFLNYVILSKLLTHCDIFFKKSHHLFQVGIIKRCKPL
jgi:hypothetical protein